MGYLLLSAGCIWLCVGLSKSGLRRTLALVTFQITLVVFCYNLLRTDLLNSFLFSIFPLPSLFSIFQSANLFSSFILSVAMWPLLFGTLAIFVSLLFQKSRPWSGTVGVLVVLSALVLAGESRSKELMCATAKDLGTDKLFRNSLLWSLQNAPEEFQFEVHAITKVNGQRWAWSYRELNWYPLNSKTNAKVVNPEFRCAK